MSDTWSDIQALKSRQSSMRERMARRKAKLEGLVADITGGSNQATSSNVKTESLETSVSASKPQETIASCNKESVKAEIKKEIVDAQLLVDVENKLQYYLSDVTLNLPIDSKQLQCVSQKLLDRYIPLSMIEDLLQKFAAQQLVVLENKNGLVEVVTADHLKISAVLGDDDDVIEGEPAAKRIKTEKEHIAETKVVNRQARQRQNKTNEANTSSAGKAELEDLLSMTSAKEKENKKMNDEILQLLSQPTAKEQSLVEKFKSQGGAQVREFCQFGTAEECKKIYDSDKPCEKLHFKKIIHQHTDEQLGDCSFLNTCYHMESCKYVHYTIDYPEGMSKPKPDLIKPIGKTNESDTVLFPPQWVQCDLRKLDMRVLGKFSVVMADPPWDIHMELPYGTMSDDEMRKLPVPCLSDDGYIFLWVTGRAMELGRECLKLWGYERIDELIWVKTNQLQRIIRTGRTGHWLNHGKEHCLIGRKGNPINMNRGLDCDVLVAEVRATSHKPDEVYGMIERLAPGTRKIELFGRPHNVQPNWITLGNQLDGVKLLEPDVVKAFKKAYPNGLVSD